ncbi:MAG: PCP reductase family protein [Gemmatimonadota bacterium]
MKFLCVECDEQMVFEERDLPGDGTLAAAFRCPSCDHRVGLLTNPMETQLVASLGVRIGGRAVPEQPFEMVRGSLAEGREKAFADTAPPEPSAATVRWSVEAIERLGAVPSFVRGMVKRIYIDYARERGIAEITPAIMDRARRELGLEGM